MMKRALIVMLAIVACAFCLAACGESSIEGTYKFYSVEYPDGTKYYSRDEMPPEVQAELQMLEQMYVTLKKDGTAESQGNFDYPAQTGTWELSEDGKKLYFNGDKVHYCTVDGDKIIQDAGGLLITLKKQ